MKKEDLASNYPGKSIPDTSGQEPAVAVVQLGARMHYAVPVILHRSGLLAQLFTDAYAGRGSWLGTAVQLLPNQLHKGPIKRLAQRQADLPGDKVTAFNGSGLLWWFELNWRRKTNGSLASFFYQQGIEFGRRIGASRHLKKATAVYGFSGASLELFKIAKRSGLFCIYEQMLAPQEETYRQLKIEEIRWPGWQKSLLEYQNEAWLSDIEHREREMADLILAPSPYVKACLVEQGVEEGKIALLPYGVSPDDYLANEPSYNSSRPLRALFVGGVNLRKGAPYLLEALQQLDPRKIEARLIGSIELNPDKLAPYLSAAAFFGHVSRRDVAAHYAWADVLVMPSLVEGSATVTYEALASGRPVIATWNSGAWVKDGYNGFLVPVRDSVSLAGRLQRLYQNPNLVHQMSRQAAASAAHFSWAAYESRLRTLILTLHKNGSGGLPVDLDLPFLPKDVNSSDGLEPKLAIKRPII